MPLQGLDETTPLSPPGRGAGGSEVGRGNGRNRGKSMSNVEQGMSNAEVLRHSTFLVRHSTFPLAGSTVPPSPVAPSPPSPLPRGGWGAGLPSDRLRMNALAIAAPDDPPSARPG